MDMTKDTMIVFMNENPNVKITHDLFSEDEYIYQKEDGKVYDENGYLFEDWYSDYIHDGLRMRTNKCWENGWRVKEDEDLCDKLNKTQSGRYYLYENYCKTCNKFL